MLFNKIEERDSVGTSKIQEKIIFILKETL